MRYQYTVGAIATPNGGSMQSFTYKLLENNTYCVESYQGNSAHVVIPDSYLGRPVTILNDRLFRGHSELREVTLPATLTDIGGWCFDGCGELRHVELPQGLVYLWQYAFVRCGIEEIAISAGVTSIMPFVFQECHGLRRVSAPSVTKVCAWAFRDCELLRPDDVVLAPGAHVSPQAFE